MPGFCHEEAEMTTPEQTPQRTYAYQLTSADLLAWLDLPSEKTPAAFLLWTVPAGLCLAVLPASWVGVPFEPKFLLSGAVLLGGWFGFFVLAIRQVQAMRARRAFPAPVDMTLQEWDDHLAEMSNGGTRTIAPRDIGAIVETPKHVFVRARADMIIVPLAAFKDAGDLHAFARRWDDKSKNAEP